MCYPKPGPRCSGHVRREILRARVAYRRKPNDETYARLRQAQEDFLSTPAGLKTLESQQDATGDAADEARYQHYKMLREEQMAAYKKTLEPTTSTEPREVLNGKQTIARALEAPLSYDGPKPQWWDRYEEDAKARAGHPVIADAKREIIDVVDSTAGKIAVIWEDHSSSVIDQYSLEEKGFQVQQMVYRSFETGEVLGYVKATSRNAASMKVAFGDDEYTPFRYDSAYSGTSYSYSRNLEEESPNPDPDALARAYWFDSVRASHDSVQTEDGKYIPYYNVTQEHIPQDMKRIKADLRKRSASIRKTIKDANDFYNKPFVDFSRMEHPINGQGFGTAAYVYTARMLAKDGNALMASGLQSDSAKPLWERLQRNFPQYVKEIEVTFPDGKRKESRLTFDFR